MGRRLTNAYHNVTNVNVLVAPSEEPARSRPAVVVVAHHDAPISSPGACVRRGRLSLREGGG